MKKETIYYVEYLFTAAKGDDGGKSPFIKSTENGVEVIKRRPAPIMETKPVSVSLANPDEYVKVREVSTVQKGNPYKTIYIAKKSSAISYPLYFYELLKFYYPESDLLTISIKDVCDRLTLTIEGENG